MPGEGRVVDASVLGAAFFEEVDTPSARRFVGCATNLLAPSLLLFEIVSIAAKKAWKGLAGPEVGERAIRETRTLVRLVEPTTELALCAYQWAREFRLSVYDASYLALAQAEDLTVVTLGARLELRARENGLGHLVRRLAET